MINTIITIIMIFIKSTHIELITRVGTSEILVMGVKFKRISEKQNPKTKHLSNEEK